MGCSLGSAREWVREAGRGQRPDRRPLRTTVGSLDFIPKALGVVHLQTLRALNREPRRCLTQRVCSEGFMESTQSPGSSARVGLEEEVNSEKPARSPQLESRHGPRRNEDLDQDPW